MFKLGAPPPTSAPAQTDAAHAAANSKMKKPEQDPTTRNNLKQT
jgi:hypothetical protein